MFEVESTGSTRKRRRWRVRLRCSATGRDTAVRWLEDALSLTTDPRSRAEIAHEVARTYASLFRWVEAVDTTDRALDELGDLDPPLRASLEAELAVAGMHDARRAHRVAAVMARLAAHRASATTNEALATAAGMGAVLTSTWDPTAVAAARQDGSARGLIAVHSSVGLLKHRLGALPEADGAARIAWRLLVEGDFAHGLGVGTIVASAATDSGDLDVAHEVLQRIPDGPPGVISVLVPAARARLATGARRRRWGRA